MADGKKNERKEWLDCITQLYKYGNKLKIRSADFGIMLGVSKHTVRSWYQRNVTPKTANVLGIYELLSELKKVNNAVGVFVIEDGKSGNTEPLKIRLITELYCKNNKLNLVEFKTITASAFTKITDINYLTNSQTIYDNQVADLVFYSRKIPLSPNLISQYKSKGIRVFHHINKKSFCVESSERTTKIDAGGCHEEPNNNVGHQDNPAEKKDSDWV